MADILLLRRTSVLLLKFSLFGTKLKTSEIQDEVEVKVVVIARQTFLLTIGISTSCLHQLSLI